jgi:hypothetical protein
MQYRGRNLVRSPRPRSAPSGPNPYNPSSPGYEERSATHVTALGNGMVREDIGEPIRRLPGESQPIPQGPKVAPPAPAKIPAAPAPAGRPSPAAVERQRNHRAITRDP